MKRNYDECVTKYSDSFVRVVLDPGYVSRIQNFVTELVEAKSKEDHHKIDSNKEVKRFTTGFLGEAALEKLFGIPIIDWTIGYSGLYHIPDIPGYRVGIKTVERDKFPIIFKDNSYPQIICIKSTKYNNLIFVCGLATSNVLNNYQDDDLILDPNLRARGTKTGFYGFEQLVPIKSLNEIIYVFLTIFLYLLKCPQSLILSALRAFCLCGKPHISRLIFLYFPCQSWLKSW